MSYRLEVEMIRMAHEKDMLTTPYVFDGFYGASSMERLPTEVALTETPCGFKRIARPA